MVMLLTWSFSHAAEFDPNLYSIPSEGSLMDHMNGTFYGEIFGRQDELKKRLQQGAVVEESTPTWTSTFSAGAGDYEYFSDRTLRYFNVEDAERYLLDLRFSIQEWSPKGTLAYNPEDVKRVLTQAQVLDANGHIKIPKAPLSLPDAVAHPVDHATIEFFNAHFERTPLIEVRATEQVLLKRPLADVLDEVILGDREAAEKVLRRELGAQGTLFEILARHQNAEHIANSLSLQADERKIVTEFLELLLMEPVTQKTLSLLKKSAPLRQAALEAIPDEA